MQIAGSAPQGNAASATAKFAAAQSAGDLNVVFIGWNDSTTTINTVMDSKGNVYQLAVGPTKISGLATQAVYYAPNIASAAANANSVTVSFNGSAPYPDLRILEYTGASATNPIDAVGAATGTSGYRERFGNDYERDRHTHRQRLSAVSDDRDRDRLYKPDAHRRTPISSKTEK